MQYMVITINDTENKLKTRTNQVGEILVRTTVIIFLLRFDSESKKYSYLRFFSLIFKDLFDAHWSNTETLTNERGVCCEEVMGGRGRVLDRVLTPTVCPNFPFGMTRPDTADFCIGEDRKCLGVTRRGGFRKYIIYLSIINT